MTPNQRPGGAGLPRPNGLPIGVAVTSMAGGTWKGNWAGLTWAACDDAKLDDKGATIKVSGVGPATGCRRCDRPPLLWSQTQTGAPPQSASHIIQKAQGTKVSCAKAAEDCRA